MSAAPRIRSTLLALALAASPLSLGCTPVVALHHTEVRGAGASGVEVIAVMEVENENAFDVEIRAVRASVTVADRYRLDTIDIQPNKWIRAGAKAKVAVPITVPWSSVPGVLAATAGASEVPYRVRGTASVTAGRSLRIKRDRYPIDQDGVIPRKVFARGGLALPF